MSAKKAYTCSSGVSICSDEALYKDKVIAPDSSILTFKYTTPSSDTFDYNNNFTINVNDFNKQLLARQPRKKIDRFYNIGRGKETSIGNPETLYGFSESKTLLDNMKDVGFPDYYADTVSGIWDSYTMEQFYVKVNGELYYPLHFSDQKYKVQTFWYMDDYYPDNHTFTTNVPVDNLFMPRDYFIDEKNGCHAYDYPVPTYFTPLWQPWGEGYSHEGHVSGYYTVDSNGADTLIFYIFPGGRTYPYPIGELQTFLKTYYIQVKLKFKTNQGFILLESADYSWKIKDQPTPKIKVTKNDYGWVTNVEFLNKYYGGFSTHGTWPDTDYEVELCFSPSWTCEVFKYKIEDSLTLPYKLNPSSTHQMQSLAYHFKNEEFSVNQNNLVLNISSTERDYPYIYTGELIMKEPFSPERSIADKTSFIATELHIGDKLQTKINDSELLSVTGKLQIDSIEILGSAEIGDNNE